MALQLRDQLSFCDCDGRLVFLDIAADRYFCLGPALETSFRSWAASPAVDADHRDFSLLRERGLLVRAQEGVLDARAASLPRATQDLCTERSPRPRDVAEALLAEFAASVRLRTRPIAKALPRPDTGTAPAELAAYVVSLRAEQIAAAFARSALILGSSGRCLVRAIAAKSVCRRSGLVVDLVLGVRLNPFGAHAWVQHGNSVLVGDYEEARQFTPILSIR